MSEIVERVTRAVLVTVYEHDDAYTEPDYEDGGISVDGSLDCRRLARVAVAEIRAALVARAQAVGYLSIEDLDAVLKPEDPSDFEVRNPPKAP